MVRHFYLSLKMTKLTILKLCLFTEEELDLCSGTGVGGDVIGGWC